MADAAPDPGAPSGPRSATALVPQRRQRNRVVVPVALVAILVGAVAVGLSRQDRESVSAWGSRGGATRDGVTSDRAVDDLSVTLWGSEVSGPDGGPGGPIPAGVTERDGALVVTGDQLLVLDRDSLELRWRAPFTGAVPESVGPEGITVVAGGDILTLALADGAITRRVPLESDVGQVERAIPVSSDGNPLVVVSAPGAIAAFRADTGEAAWRRPVAPSDRWVRVLHADGDVVVAGHESEVTTLDTSTGEVLWELDLGETDHWVPHWHQVADGVLVTTGSTTGRATVRATDLVTGHEHWAREFGAAVELAHVHEDHVLVRSREPGGPEPRWIHVETGEDVGGRSALPGVPEIAEIRVLGPGDVLVQGPGGLERVVDGQVLWQASIGVDWALPVAHEELLVASADDGGVVVADAASGRERIRLDIPQRWSGSLTLAGDLVRVAWARSGVLHLGDGTPLDSTTSDLWLGPGDVTAPWGMLRADEEGNLVAVDADGSERWRRDLSRHVDSGVYTTRDTGVLATLEDIVLAFETRRSPDPEAAPEFELVVLDAATGGEVDREPFALHPGSVVAEGHAIWGYAWSSASSDTATELVRFDLDGRRLELDLAWRRPAGTGSLLLAGDRLLEIGGAGVVVRDPDSGEQLDRIPLPTLSGGPPVAVGDLVVVDDGHRGLYAVDLRDGTVRWHHETAAPIVADAVVAGDRLYTATADGHIEVLQVATGELLTSQDVAPDGVDTGALLAARDVVIARFDDVVYAVGGADGVRDLDDRAAEGAG